MGGTYFVKYIVDVNVLADLRSLDQDLHAEEKNKKTTDHLQTSLQRDVSDTELCLKTHTAGQSIQWSTVCWWL